MTFERTPPTGWILETEQTIHDGFSGRDDTTVLYRQEHTGETVYIDELIAGRNVWEYKVHHSGSDGQLGTAADLEAAKQIAYLFMNDSAATA